MPDVTPIPKPEPKVSHKGRRQKGARLERRIAKSLGGKRTPMSGGSPLGGGDVVVEGFSVECKARAELPALVKNAFLQAEADLAIGDNRRPLVVLCADKQEPIYCMKESDWLAMRDEHGPQQAFDIRARARAIAAHAKAIEGLAT